MLVDITRVESVVIGGLFEQDPFCLPREESLTELSRAPGEADSVARQGGLTWGTHSNLTPGNERVNLRMPMKN